MKKNIYLYTGSFPYGPTTESFIGPELKVVDSLEGYNVRVIPVIKDCPKRTVPSNIIVDDSICKAGIYYKLKALLRIFSFSTLGLIIKDRSEITKLQYIVHLFKYVYASNLVYLDVCKRAKSEEKITFYSYWMSYAPIAFGLYKKKYPHTKHLFISRGHGGDVYTTERGRYYPFRNFVFETIDHVYVVSNYGRDYLREKYPVYKEKIDRAYLGVMPLEACKKEIGSWKVVSCSSVYDFKRVDLLFRSLEQYAINHPEQRMEWTHFGGGYLFDSLKKEVESKHKASNLTINLKGRCSNEDVLKHYCCENYHVFIHLSTTEGLPVSMMEALSASIPIIATAVGGVPEIVTERTGRLLDVNFKQEDFDNNLTSVLSNYKDLSTKAHDFYNENFNAYNNYRKFYETITNL